MSGQHGASPKFHAPDNMAEAVTFAANDAGISVGVARHLLTTFLRKWTGPRGGSGVPLEMIARRIEDLPDA